MPSDMCVKNQDFIPFLIPFLAQRVSYEIVVTRGDYLLDRILDSLEVGLSGCDNRLHFFSETPKFNFRSSKFNFRSTETAKLELEPFL